MSLKPLITIARKGCGGEDPQSAAEKMAKVKELLEEADKLLLEASQWPVVVLFALLLAVTLFICNGFVEDAAVVIWNVLNKNFNGTQA